MARIFAFVRAADTVGDTVGDTAYWEVLGRGTPLRFPLMSERRTGMNRWTVVAGVLAAGILVAGALTACGGSDDATDPGPASVTVTETVTAAPTAPTAPPAASGDSLDWTLAVAGYEALLASQPRASEVEAELDECPLGDLDFVGPPDPDDDAGQVEASSNGLTYVACGREYDGAEVSHEGYFVVDTDDLPDLMSTLGVEDYDAESIDGLEGAVAADIDLDDDGTQCIAAVALPDVRFAAVRSSDGGTCVDPLVAALPVIHAALAARA